MSDLLNDDRDFLPLVSLSGEMRVISKRAIMEIQIVESKREVDDDVTVVISGNAYELLGAPHDADDAMVRAIYLDRMNSVDPERVRAATDNPDLIAAAAHLRDRYAAAYDAISHSRQIEAIAVAMKIAHIKQHRA